MSKHNTAYEIARSQIATQEDVIRLFWRITHRYRSHFSSVLDLGAGDGRFALSGNYKSYEGIEIDINRPPITNLPRTATIINNCVFEHQKEGYAACIGNPPYVRHHDIEEKWRDSVAERLTKKTDLRINRNCNLYVYFMFLALLKARSDGLVSVLVPYEWVSRPSAKSLRKYIISNGWHVDIYKFVESIFNDVLTTASISVIDKKKRDGLWSYNMIDRNGDIFQLNSVTGSDCDILPYEVRGQLWAMRGMSPGTQKVFTLTEGERIHAGLHQDDVLPCVTSLRDVPSSLLRLTESAFRKRFVEGGAKCWLIKSYESTISTRLQAYLDNVSPALHDTWTCNTRKPWYRFPLSEAPKLLVSTGFISFGPKVLINEVKAYAVGSVCGIYSDTKIDWSSLQSYLVGFDFEKRVVPHAKKLKKIEIGQLNSVLNYFFQQGMHHA